MHKYIAREIFSQFRNVNLPQKNVNNQSGYEPLNMENVSFLNRDSFDAADLRF